MYNQVLLVSIVAVLLQPVQPQNTEGKVETIGGYDLIFSKLESRLNLASKIADTTKRELRNDIRKICRDRSCSSVSVDCNKWKRRSSDGRPMDCGDIYSDGFTTSGIYQIWPKTKPSNEPLPVYCDMEDGGGWTVIQRRGIFGNQKDYFFQGWNAYKRGFGHLLREFWIGNDNLFTLTSQRSYQLKVDLTSYDDDGSGSSMKYATYEEFWVDDELHNYTLHIGPYEGTAGDSLSSQNGNKFSTYDRNNDDSREGEFSCADEYEGAWWYSACTDSNLNGQHEKHRYDFIAGISWKTFKGETYALMATVMKIRPANFS